MPPGKEIEVTALWDLRERRGQYVITATVGAFSQIHESRTDDNSPTVQVMVHNNRVMVV